jgi:hypothetical protein
MPWTFDGKRTIPFDNRLLSQGVSVMADPVTDAKVGLKVWEYFGVARDIWEQLKVAPEKIAKLERQVADLEAQLARAPGEACKHCGALAMRLQTSTRALSMYGRFGAREEKWQCTECNHEAIETVYPKNMPRVKS